MKRYTYKRKLVTVCVCVLFLLTGCAQSTSSEESGVMSMLPEECGVYKLTEADRETGVENAKEVSPEAGQTVLTIDEPGDYLLRGKTEGQIQIDVEDEMVHLVLDNVEMQSRSGPAIYVKSASKVVITIPEGSSSILMDSTNYADFAEAEACIYSVSDLTINGGGSLRVYGYYNDAIRTRDTLKLLDICLDLQAKDTGLRGNDGVVVQTQTLDIQCEGTGIYTEKEKKVNKGFVDIAKGTVGIIAGEYGIDAAGNVYVHDCKANIWGVIQNITCLGEQYIEEGCLE